MSIESVTTVVESDDRAVRKIAVKQISFESRKATFLVRTDNSPHARDWAVMFRVGPLGLNVNVDEAEAIGHALIDAAAHFRAAAGASEVEPS